MASIRDERSRRERQNKADATLEGFVLDAKHWGH